MALAHKEPDHVPMDLGAHGATGIHYLAYQKLREHLGLPSRPPFIWHPMQQLADPEEDILKIAQADVRRLPRRTSSHWKLEIAEKDGTQSFDDEFGITFYKPAGGFYFDPRGHPLAYAETTQDIEKFPWPDGKDPARFEGMVERARILRESTGAAIVLSSLSPGAFEMGQWLRGFDQFMVDLVLNQKLAFAIINKIVEIKIDYWNTVLPLVRDYVDVVGESDDLGSQDGLLISPDLYRRFLKPAHAQIFAAIRKHTDAPIFFHSCGAVRDLIPDLIECGVNVLNPVQVSAQNMDTRRLKKDFGDVVSFWGGGCDTQVILPKGSPSEVREEVKRRIDDLAPGGGFVFTPVHNIQADVPPENILAMWEAWRDHGAYH